jgi:hypothetical protein
MTCIALFGLHVFWRCKRYFLLYLNGNQLLHLGMNFLSPIHGVYKNKITLCVVCVVKCKNLGCEPLSQMQSHRCGGQDCL